MSQTNKKCVECKKDFCVKTPRQESIINPPGSYDKESTNTASLKLELSKLCDDCRALCFKRNQTEMDKFSSYLEQFKNKSAHEIDFLEIIKKMPQ